MTDWKIFVGDGRQHDRLRELPDPPPWRFSHNAAEITPAPQSDDAERRRAEPFRPSEEMVRAVNAALYLRRPLLLTGRPGSGKSTLISKVAHELKLGEVLRWPINSRSTVRSGVYDYDAVGRLQSGQGEALGVEKYLKLGPLGTALIAVGRPRALLVDEIDKSDLDFANDLLNVIEEGEYEIPELKRLNQREAKVEDVRGNLVRVVDGKLSGDHFPFVMMTSNGEREFPAPFLRRCVRLHVELPTREQLLDIVQSHFKSYQKDPESVDALLTEYLQKREQGDVSTDQLLNAVFLTVAMREGGARTFKDDELVKLRADLMRHISGANA